MNEPTILDDADEFAPDVRAAQSGDAAALEQLVLAVRDRVYRLSLRMTASPPNAEDATQEILIRVITRLSTFRGRLRSRRGCIASPSTICSTDRRTALNKWR